MANSLPEDPRWKRRGCTLLAIFAVIFVILLIAISSGWLGTIDTNKVTRMIPIG